MKKLYFAALLYSLTCAFSLYAQDIAPVIIPQPVNITYQKGVYFALPSPATISANTPAAVEVADFLKEKLLPATGYNFRITEQGDIQLNINTIPDPKLGNEGYILSVTTAGINISANKPAGLFYGVQSLLQLLPKEIERKTIVKKTWLIPTVEITDYPRFEWRGLMLDVSRHFFTVDEVKQYIDNMAKYKYNTFHWHLTDDHGWRIEIKALPQLTKIGACRVKREGKFGNFEFPKDGEPATDCGYYTQEQIKDVIAYAATRHIQVIPEIDVPGHSSAAIASYPYLSCTKDGKTFVNPGSNIAQWDSAGNFKGLTVDNSLNPSDERVYTFIDLVFSEVAVLFPYPYIHMGGDECYKGYWENDPGCKAFMQQNGLRHVNELQSYFVKRVEKIIESKGKKLIGWDEILQGGIAPNAAVMSWQSINGGIEAAKMGHYVVMTPNQNVYIDLPQGDISVEPDALTYGTVRLKSAYLFEPVPNEIDSKYILGGQANLWTEKVYDMKHAQYMTYPRAWALADVYWSPKEKRDWNGFVKRMETYMHRADIAGINYARSTYDAIVKPRVENNILTVTIETEVDGIDIYYTTNNSTPNIQSERYKQPITKEGDYTLKVTTYRNGRQIGKIISLDYNELMKRAKK